MDALDFSGCALDPAPQCRLDLSLPPGLSEPADHWTEGPDKQPTAAPIHRDLFIERLGAVIRRHRRHRLCFAVLLLDLHDLDPIGQEWGQGAMGQVLHIFTERLQSGLRKRDLAVRLDPGRFGLILEEVLGQTKVSRVMQRLRYQSSRPIPIKGVNIRLSVSLGCALYPQDGIEPRELLQRAARAIPAAHKGVSRGEKTGPEPERHGPIEEAPLAADRIRETLPLGT